MLKQTELKNQWNKEKEKMMKKIKNLNTRQNPIKLTIPATYKDILIGDKELKEEFITCNISTKERSSLAN